MPKLKTHSGAKKRFNLTKTGKVKRAKAYKSHILTKKDTKRTRRLRAGGEAAFAAAQLQPQLPGLGHQLPPLARHGVGLPDQAVAAALHPGDQILFLSHPHVSTSSWVGSRSDFRKTPPGSPPYIQNAIVPYRPGAVNGGVDFLLARKAKR